MNIRDHLDFRLIAVSSKSQYQTTRSKSNKRIYYSMSENNKKPLAVTFVAGAAVGAIAVAYLSRARKVDPARKAEDHLLKIAEHSMTGGLIRVCDKLQLYEALWQSGPSTAAELAQKMRCSERWLTEILSQATAAGICVYFFGKFCLKPEYAHLLRDPKDSPRSIIGVFDMVACLLSRTDATVESVKTGLGKTYDYGEDVTAAIDRKNTNWFHNKLEGDVLRQVKTTKMGEKTLVELLEEGIQVADVGCGYGASVLAMAKRFPQSQFCAFEACKKSVKKLGERVKEAKLSNVTVYDVATRSLADGPTQGGKFDFIYAHDVVHDMTKPKDFIRDAKHTLSDKGVFVIVDIKCCENLKQNIAQTDAALHYGFSNFLCLASSASEKNAAGLGTCGFPEGLAQSWTKNEGFESFETIEIASLPMNSCFVVS